MVLAFGPCLSISSGSGGFLAASVIPARQGKAIRLSWVPSIPPRGVHVLATLSPLAPSSQALGTLSAGLPRGDFPPQTQEMGE